MSAKITLKTALSGIFLLLLGTAFTVVSLGVQDARYKALLAREEAFQTRVLNELDSIKLNLAGIDTRFERFVQGLQSSLDALVPQRGVPAPVEYHDLLQKASDRWGTPIVILCAIASGETGWVANAIGPVNKDGTRDYGLFQLNSKTIPILIKKYWDRKEKFRWDNPEHNAYLASAYLAENYAFLGSWSKSVTAFNAGPGFVLNNPSRITVYFEKVQARLVAFADKILEDRL